MSTHAALWPRLRTAPLLSTPRPRAAALSLIGITVLVVGVVFGALIESAGVLSDGRPPALSAFVRLGAGAAMLSLAILLVARLPRHAMTAALSAAALGEAVGAAAATYATYSHFVNPLPLGIGAGWVAEWASAPILLIPGVALLLFPTGKLPSRRWRPALWCGLAAPVLVALSGMLGTPDNLEFQANPLIAESTARTLGATFGIGWLLALGAAAAGVAALVQRRRAPGLDADTRAQLDLMTRAGLCVLAAFIACTAGSLISPAAFDVGALAAIASLAALAVVMAVAMLRHRLYGLDVYIDRTLVLTATTVGLGALYVGAVVLAGRVLGQDVDLGVALPATVLVAVAFHPVRERVRNSVAHLLHGQRDEPYAAVSALGRRLGEPMPADRVLPVLVETIAETLRLPYAAVELAGAAGLAGAEHGTAVAGIALRIPLEHAGQRVGTLVVGQRGHRDGLDEADRRLLVVFSVRAAAAASAVALSADVQRSRERLVTAREEERRRLRADLHDGLGPKLAGAVLTIDAARRLLRTDPDAADGLLDRAAGSVEETVDDVRRVVYALRPPALDQLGLIGALRQQADALTAPGGLACSVEAPGPLLALPAAVEVAVYRIVQEGLANVTRHAHATRAVVRLSLGEELRVEIADDGVGIPDAPQSGVGLTSMRERAAELGGTCDFLAAPDGGTLVRVRLPLARSPSHSA